MCPSCRGVFAIDTKPNVDLEIKYCPQCDGNKRLQGIDTNVVSKIKLDYPKASILYYDSFVDKE